MSGQLPTEIRPNRLLTAAEFHRLADVPPEIEWFANISNAHTRCAYENALRDFMQFAGIRRPKELRSRRPRTVPISIPSSSRRFRRRRAPGCCLWSPPRTAGGVHG